MRPHNHLFSLAEFPQIGPSDNLLFGLFRVTGYFAAPDGPQGQAVKEGPHIFDRCGFTEARFSDDQGLALKKPHQEAEKQGRVKFFSFDPQIRAI